MKISIDIRDKSIGFIKFIGRHHSLLTSIMDQINVCYSFQVKHNWFISNNIFLAVIMIIFSKIDNVKCGSDFYIFRPNILHILCVYFWRKWFVKRAVMGTFVVGIVLFGFHAYKYSYGKSSVMWSEYSLPFTNLQRHDPNI